MISLSGKKYILIILIVLIVIAGLTAVNFFLSKNNPQENQQVVSPRLTPISVSSSVQDDMISFIKNSIPNSYIPATYKIYNQPVIGPTYLFYQTIWTEPENFSITVIYDGNQLISRLIQATVPKNLFDFSTSSSATLAQTYLLIQPKHAFICNRDQNVCESFWYNQNTQTKAGIEITRDIQKISQLDITYCERWPTHPAYQWQSCDIKYHVSGVH